MNRGGIPCECQFRPRPAVVFQALQAWSIARLHLMQAS